MCELRAQNNPESTVIPDFPHLVAVSVIGGVSLLVTRTSLAAGSSQRGAGNVPRGTSRALAVRLHEDGEFAVESGQERVIALPHERWGEQLTTARRVSPKEK